MLYEALKASKGIYTDDTLAKIWGVKLRKGGVVETSITGALPLSFTARAQQALKNYHLYGISEGAGVETENIFNPNAQDVEKGFVEGRYLVENGSAYTGSAWDISEYIEVEPTTTYTIAPRTSSSSPSIVEYDVNKNYVAGHKYNGNTEVTITTGATTKYVRASVQKNNRMSIMLTKGSTAPTSYIPYGYKIPLTVTCGQNTDNYPLYIGSTKLGAEEYLDYQEQKVWKRTENLFDIFAITENKYLNPNTATLENTANSNTSDFIEIIDNFITLSYSRSQALYSTATREMLFYDNNKNRTGVAYYDPATSGRTFEVGVYAQNVKYVRFDYDKSFENIMLVPGSAAPESYIPYLQPTDPPAPLPEITAYEGENTLSSTEALGSVTITGYIKEQGE